MLLFLCFKMFIHELYIEFSVSTVWLLYSELGARQAVETVCMRIYGLILQVFLQQIELYIAFLILLYSGLSDLVLDGMPVVVSCLIFDQVLLLF